MRLEVLIVAAGDESSRALEEALAKGGLVSVCRRVGNARAMEQALAEGSWDIVLADLDAPDFGAAEAVEVLAESGRDVPLIAIPEQAGLEPFVAMAHKGLRNVVARQRLDTLASTVEQEMRGREARRRQREREAELRRQANQDSLTDLPNRRLFFDRLSQGLKRARRQRGRLSLLFIDLDDFKVINDARGHAVGDTLLQEVARRLESTIRESDTAARLGGDEFAIVLDGVVEDGAAAAVAGKIQDSLSRPFHLVGGAHTVTASIGIATYPADGEDVDSLLASADASMYRDKRRSFRARSRAPRPGGIGGRAASIPWTAAVASLAGRLPSPVVWASAVPVAAALLVAVWFVLSALTGGAGPEASRIAGGGAETSSDIDMAPASGPSE